MESRSATPPLRDSGTTAPLKNEPQPIAQRTNVANPLTANGHNRWRRPAVEGEVLAPEPPPERGTRHNDAGPIPPAHAIYRRPATSNGSHRYASDRHVPDTQVSDRDTADRNLANNGRYHNVAGADQGRAQSTKGEAANGYEAAAVDEWRAHAAPSHWDEQRQRTRKPATARSQLADLFTGEDGMRRVLTTRMALDDALDRWWTHAELAPLSLLRDGLLVLEAGHDLDETQRSFLLRTALRTGRGMVTALHYQLDADRTAFLIKEALLDTKHTFDPKLIHYLRAEDEQSEEWADYLEHDLAYEATVASGKRSQLAAAALSEMQQPSTRMGAASTAALGSTFSDTGPAPPPPTPLPNLLVSLHAATAQSNRGQGPSAMRNAQLLPLSHRWSLRWLLWACLTVLLLLSFGWPQLRVTSAMVTIPAGTYLVSDPTSTDPTTSGRFQSVTLPAYRIDQREVSNAAYRRCWEQEVCPIPSSFDSRTRPGYFANRAYDAFPVVNVDWGAANTYCSWVGKRLPTLEEWEVAASLAPATGRRFIYPWGDRFDVRLGNSAESNVGDTQSGGTYHPAGSTTSGLMDMAGNVAEWTAMPAASMVDGFVVKGGSYLDSPQQLRNDALAELQRDTTEPWLGFRCAADE